MTRQQRLTVVLVLNLGLVAGLVAVGLTAHSLAVLAAGSDYLLDAAAVGVALLSARPAAAPGRAATRMPPALPHWLTPAGCWRSSYSSSSRQWTG